MKVTCEKGIEELIGALGFGIDVPKIQKNEVCSERGSACQCLSKYYFGM